MSWSLRLLQLNNVLNNNCKSLIKSNTMQGKILPGMTGSIFGNPVRAICLSGKNCDMFKIQDEADFKEKVLESKVPVIVDFYATWCGPCKILTPRIETIVATHKDKINLAMVDVDEQEDIAMKYEIQAMPTVLAIKDGKVVDKFLGLQDDDQIRAFVKKVLGA